MCQKMIEKDHENVKETINEKFDKTYYMKHNDKQKKKLITFKLQ